MKTIFNTRLLVFSFLFLLGACTICLRTWGSIPPTLWQPINDTLPPCAGKNLTPAQQAEIKNLLNDYLATWRSICSLVCNFKQPVFIHHSMQEQLFHLKKIIAKLDEKYDRIKEFYARVGCPGNCCLYTFERDHHYFLNQLLTAS